MSGGSWDYLYAKSAEEIDSYRGDIKQMGERLIKEGYPEIGKRFLLFVEDLEIINIKKQVFMDKYSQVMRAIEWWDSGDSGPDALEKAVNKLISLARDQGEGEKK